MVEFSLFSFGLGIMAGGVFCFTWDLALYLVRIRALRKRERKLTPR